jgi:rhodanese-related sulfurtransferase
VLSPLSARKAEKAGYKNVKVFHAGIPAWKKAGHVVVSNMAQIDYLNKINGSYILLDLRSQDKIKKGHIPKAVAAADGKVDTLKTQFPKYKKAPIILYNEDGNLDAAKAAYKAVVGWGYNQVSILDVGFAGWKKANKEIATGPAQSKITYVRKLLPGEIDYEDFKKLVSKPSKDYLIIDTRSADEFHACGLPYAFNIPLDLLESRLNQLPKDMTMIIHCNTGVRAEMAHSILAKAGFKSKYLKDVVKMDRLDSATCELK